MSDIKNLWPQNFLDNSNIVLPITILQEQAKYFNEMTKNVVTANIDTKNVSIQSKVKEGSKPAIMHSLKITAPTIGYYDFDLVSIIQEGILPYPNNVYSAITELYAEVKSAEELEHVLTEIFNHEKTVATIQSLIMQSK